MYILYIYIYFLFHIERLFVLLYGIAIAPRKIVA